MSNPHTLEISMPCERHPDGECNGTGDYYDFCFWDRDYDFEEVRVHVPMCSSPNHWYYRESRPLLRAAAFIKQAVGVRLVRVSDIENMGMREPSSYHPNRGAPKYLRPVYCHASPNSRFYTLGDVIRKNPKRECCLCGRRGRAWMKSLAEEMSRDVSLLRSWARFFQDRRLPVEKVPDHYWICDWRRPVVRKGCSHPRTPDAFLWRKGKLADWLRHRVEVGTDKRDRELAREYKLEVQACRRQLKAIRTYLKSGDPGVLTSLPEGYGPRPTSPG